MAYCRCGSNAFQVSKQDVQLDERHSVKVKFIVCSNPKCQQVVGVLSGKIAKTKSIKLPSVSKPANKINVVKKPQGAVMTGLELAQKKIDATTTAKPVKKASTTSNIGNTFSAPQTTSVSSVVTDAPNIANANVTTTSNTLSERKTKKTKK